MQNPQRRLGLLLYGLFRFELAQLSLAPS